MNHGLVSIEHILKGLRLPESFTYPKISQVVSLFIREVVLAVYQIPDEQLLMRGPVFDSQEFQRIQEAVKDAITSGD